MGVRGSAPVCLGIALVVAGAAAAAAHPPKPVSFASPAFAFSTDVGDNGSPRQEETADFNGDGLQDVVLVRAHWPTFDTYPVQIYLNDGHGHFRDGTTAVFDGAPPRVQWPRQLVVSDFNGDGRADIFVADTGYDHSPGPGFQNTLILSTPGGHLQDATANLPQQSDFSHSAVAADVNGDGTVDLYVGNVYGEIQKHGPEVLFNDGTGKFTACGDCLPRTVVDPLGNSPTYTASLLVDVNGDASPDLVLGPNGINVAGLGVITTPPLVLLNDGTGRFGVSPGALPASPFDGTGYALDVETADLNGDRRPDLLFAYTKTDPYAVGRWIQLLVNNGDGTFRDETAMRLPQTDNAVDTWIKRLKLVDLNGDGASDILAQLVDGGSDPAPAYVNDGHGAFRALAAGYSRTVDNVFALVDLRNGGRRDLLVTSTHLAPTAPTVLVAQLGAILRPGRPQAPVVSRHGSGATLWWPYDWGATKYEVWRAASPTRPRTLIGTTRLTRFVDPSTSVGAAYWLRAANRGGTSLFGDAAPAR